MNDSSVDSTTSAAGMTRILSAPSTGGVRPLDGSRRITSPLNTVPRPITTKHIVMDALGWSMYRVSGPHASGTNAAMNSTPP
jgi:hypothetical protein